MAVESWNYTYFWAIFKVLIWTAVGESESANLNFWVAVDPRIFKICIRLGFLPRSRGELRSVTTMTSEWRQIVRSGPASDDIGLNPSDKIKVPGARFCVARSHFYCAVERRSALDFGDDSRALGLCAVRTNFSVELFAVRKVRQSRGRNLADREVDWQIG